MKSQLLVLRAFSFASFSFRFRKLATTSAVVLAALSPALLWASPMAEKAAIDRSTYVTVIGGRLGNASDATFFADPADEKIGNLQPLKPGSDATYSAIALEQRIDTQWDWKASVHSTLTDTASEFTPRPNTMDSDQWASNGLRLSTGDFEVGYDPHVSPNYDVRLFAGARVVRARNDIGYRYQNFSDDKIGSKSDHGTYAHKNEVRAIGPRLGLDAAIPLDKSGLRLVASMSGSVVFGKFDSHSSYTLHDDPSAPVEGGESYSQDKKITNAQASIGLQFDLAADSKLEIGYRAETWHGLLNSVDDAHGWLGDFTQGGSTDVKFQGPYLALTWKFGS